MEPSTCLKCKCASDSFPLAFMDYISTLKESFARRFRG